MKNKQTKRGFNDKIQKEEWDRMSCVKMESKGEIKIGHPNTR